MNFAPGTIFITGGSSGIGRATATLFAQRGWRVGLIARGQAGLEDAAADLRGRERRSPSPPPTCLWAMH